MPGTVSGALSTNNARDQLMRIALIANGTTPTSRIVPVNIEIAAGSPVTGSNSAQAITVESVTLPTAIEVGQFLLFGDGAAGRVLFEATTRIAAGTVTEITGIMAEDAAAGFTADFPILFNGVGEISLGETTALQTFAMFSHGGSSDVARGESTDTLSASGAGVSYYAAALNTVVEAKRLGRDLYVEVEDTNPNPDVFIAHGPIEWSIGIVDDVSKSGADGDKLTRTVSMQLSGGIRRVNPA